MEHICSPHSLFLNSYNFYWISSGKGSAECFIECISYNLTIQPDSIILFCYRYSHQSMKDGVNLLF